MESLNMGELWFFLPRSTIKTALLTFVFLILIVLLWKEGKKKRSVKGSSFLLFWAFGSYFYVNFVLSRFFLLPSVLIILMFIFTIFLSNKCMGMVLCISLLYALILGISLQTIKNISMDIFVENLIPMPEIKYEKLRIGSKKCQIPQENMLDIRPKNDLPLSEK